MNPTLKHELWKVAKLVKIYEDGQLLMEPPYQRKTLPKPALAKSLHQSAKSEGALPLGLVLRELTNNDRYRFEIIDGRGRAIEILKNKPQFPRQVDLPIALYQNMDYDQARDLYSRLNTTQVSHSTGEVLKAHVQEFPTSLRKFVNNTVWSVYKFRYGNYRLAAMLFFESQGISAYALKSMLANIQTYDDSKTDHDKLERVVDKVSKSQGILAQIIVTNQSFKQSTWWPVMWMYRALESDPSLENKSTSRLARGFNSWYGIISSRPGTFNTSQPQRPQTEESKDMKSLIKAFQEA